jgi:hypothetical protein
MPHPQEWKTLPHVNGFFSTGMPTCVRCHARGPQVKARDFCDACHHPQGDQQASWSKSHPGAVKANGTKDCFACHAPATCATCHRDEGEDFSADQARYGSPAASPSPATTP